MYFYREFRHVEMVRLIMAIQHWPMTTCMMINKMNRLAGTVHKSISYQAEELNSDSFYYRRSAAQVFYWLSEAP